ncbi:caspase family protein [Streptomyces sp. NPDC059786]|uniref:caspase family protein n=1 Tax=Streptomyces sp. NPDC059786 TaxID=3346946 RepID=UPI00365225C0
MDRFDPRGQANRALLVGVGEYDFKRPKHPYGVPGDLGAVQHNVSLLADALRRGGVFREDEVSVCRSPYLDAFSQSLRTAVAEAEGLLLFYFAGHGAVPSAGDELFLQLRNAQVVAGSTAVFPGADPFTSVLTVLATSRARQVVVVLDCCNAGNAAQVWEGFRDKQRISLLMCVQANNRIDAGDDRTPTPFTAQLVELLEHGVGGHGGEVGFRELSEALRTHMAAHHRTLRKETWEPQYRVGTPDSDILLARPGAEPLAGREPERREPPARVPPPGREPGAPGRRRPQPRAWGRPVTAGIARLLERVKRFAGRSRRRRRPWASRRVVAVACLAATAALGLLGYLLVAGGSGQSACRPPLELRLLTDPDLEQTVRTAADAYLTSAANRTDDGCRRSGITVYSAGAAETVTALHERTDVWQAPVTDDDNPQRDIGPQPDVWIPAAKTDVARVTVGRDPRVFAELLPDSGPFTYSPMVLALPQDIAAEGLAERTGNSLARLLAAMDERDPGAAVRRTDPEYTDAALLATMGLYGGRPVDAAAAEHVVAQPGPPSPTAAELLCALSADKSTDEHTAALIPEFLLRNLPDCNATTREQRTAEYPDDVPGLEPTFVRVRWAGAERDRPEREEAVEAFHDWLTDRQGGLKVFGDDGFRDASGRRDPITEPPSGSGVLAAPGTPEVKAGREAMTTTLDEYRNARGPGRVLYLLDSSGSMGGWWEGPGGGPAILKQSLVGLGAEDEYGVWAVAENGDRAYRELLAFGRHRRADAERAIDRKAVVRDAESDPYRALTAALDEMAGRGTDDDRPQLIVYVTDDEDNGHLSDDELDTVLAAARETKVPVAMVSLAGGGCDADKPDARISRASGGRCIDTGGDIGAGLRTEVARTGTGEE